MDALRNKPTKYILHDGTWVAWEDEEGYRKTGVIRWNENVDGWVIIQPWNATPRTLGVIDNLPWAWLMIYQIKVGSEWLYTRKPKDWQIGDKPFKGIEAEYELAITDDHGIFRG